MDYTFNAYTLIHNLHTASVILQDFAIAAGAILMYLGFMKFKRYGEMRTFMSTQMTMSTPLMLVLGGSILMFTPYLLGTALEAFWSTANPLTYMGNTTPGMEGIMHAIIIFIRLLGMGVFIRGWIMLAKSGGEGVQPGMRSKALMHLFIGVLMMHFLGTEHLIMEALGFAGG